jgi:hypothetical protein
MEQLGQEITLSHINFRTSLYCHLFSFLQSARIYCLQQELGGKRLFGNHLDHIYQRTRRDIANPCKWCQYQVKYQKLIGQPVAQRAART